MKITIATKLPVSKEAAWNYVNDPRHIVHWCYASDDWCAPTSRNEVVVGGRLVTRMEAKDGSMGFDFGGTYEKVIPYEYYDLVMDDGRHVETYFESVEDGTQVTEVFDIEDQNSAEMQRVGWQSILDHLKAYVEKEIAH